jgi:hypothetical protein
MISSGSERGQILGCFGNVDDNLSSKEGRTSRFASGLFNEQEKPWSCVSYGIYGTRINK